MGARRGELLVADWLQACRYAPRSPGLRTHVRRQLSEDGHHGGGDEGPVQDGGDADPVLAGWRGTEQTGQKECDVWGVY